MRVLYDLSATSNNLGAWQFGIRLSEGERRTINFTLREAISISGTLLMLDNRTPHVAVVVQAMRNGKVVATTLSDEAGKYRFIGLRSGRYKVRCQVLGGYVYYRATNDALPVTRYEEQATASAMQGDAGETLHVEVGKTLKNVDLRFPPFKKGTWRKFTSHHGLLHNRVSAIHGTPDGIMWFGTFGGGVSRYDGEGFVNSTTEDGLPHQDVLSIYCAPDAMMWFGTGGLDAGAGGVSRYDGEEFVNFTAEYGLPHKGVLDIYRAPDGAMWFATFGSGVFRYDGNEFANFTTEDGLAHDLALDIYRDPSGAMWFGTYGGVSRYDGKEFTSFTTQDGLTGNLVNDIYCDPNGVMWFATGHVLANLRGGVSRYDGNQFVRFTKEEGLAGDYVMAICAEPDGMLWFATHGGGVSRYDGKGFVNFTKADGLSHNGVWDIYREPNGMMWFGTFGGGVSRYDAKSFVNFTTRDGLAHDSVRALHRDVSGVMWFGTEGGISRYDGNQFINFTTKDGSIPHNWIHAIDCAPDGVAWFGGDSGVSRYDGKEFVNLSGKDGLLYARDVHCAPDGSVWFAGGGVSQYDGEEFTNFTTQDGLVDNSVQGICRAPDGILWIATDGGVSRYDGNQFVNFTAKDGLAGNDVHAVCSDADGVMWFGAEGGISRYNGKDFAKFTVKDGLTQSDIRALCFTSDGMLWCGTYGGGVSMYDGTAWSSLDMRDGLAGDVVFAIHQDSDGSLWFGTEGGVTHYHRSTDRPKVHIVSVTADQPYHDLSAIPAFATGTRVTVEYKALDFKTVPEKRQYRVRIRELDDDWRRPTKSHFFDHTFKQAGTYAFEVQAIDRDLNYSQPASLTLKVVLPFYLRAGFLVSTVGGGAIMLAVLTIVSIGYIKRRRQVQAYQRLAVQELQDANRVQMSLMPESAPPIKGIEIASKCIPANTVSGDFFDYLEGKRKNSIGLVVADVTGKAMKGAMNAVMVDGVLHAKAEEMANLSPASLMSKLNNVLTARMELDMNVTMVIGVIDADSKTLTLANAAHHAYPILQRDGEIQVLKTGGLPLGMKAGIQYTEEQFQLQNGDVLILMTDGIIEAKDGEDKDYSESGRLEAIIQQFTSGISAEAMVEAIINDAIDYSADKAHRDDDMTVVVAKVL